MLDWPTLLKCHAHVPVWYWPVLWHYLARLEATAQMCREEGRAGFGWHLERNGVIWISIMGDSEAERRARGALPADFDRTPWARLDPDLRPVWQLSEATGTRWPAQTPPMHHWDTAGALPVHRPATEARGPPDPHPEPERSLILSAVEGRGWARRPQHQHASSFDCAQDEVSNKSDQNTALPASSAAASAA